MRRSHMSTRAGAGSRAPRARRGFTIAELILAMVILAVGILALAGGSVGVLRQMRNGNQMTIAATVAQSRMEKLRSRGCSFITAGNATTRGLAEVWTVTPLSGRADSVSETVTYIPGPRVSKTYILNSVIPCK